MFVMKARWLLSTIGVVSLLLMAHRTPIVDAQAPDFSMAPDLQERSVYVELAITAPTPTYQAPSLSSPQIGFISAGETINAAPGAVIGDSGVAFVRCRRISGEDLGYCPISGTANTLANTLIATTPFVMPGLISGQGLDSGACNAFGQCTIMTDGGTIIQTVTPVVSVGFDR